MQRRPADVAGWRCKVRRSGLPTLAALAGLPPERRGARYRWVLAPALPERKQAVSHRARAAGRMASILAREGF